MTNTTIDRLVKHIRTENRPGGIADQAEREWATQNLPQSKAEFRRVLAAVRASGWGGALDIDIAAILLRTTTFSPEIPGTPMMLCQHSQPELAKTWGVPSHQDRTSWPKTHGTRRSCVVCEAPAISRANFGWACANHYDELS